MQKVNIKQSNRSRLRNRIYNNSTFGNIFSRNQCHMVVINLIISCTCNKLWQFIVVFRQKWMHPDWLENRWRNEASIKNFRKWESGTLQKWGKVCNVADLPPGKICNERGKICNVSNLPPWGKVCNVADLPGEVLQCCRSSGGKVCNVADIPGERSARG